MNSITKIVGVLAAVAAASSVFAQTQPENPALAGSSGVLGFRYAEAGFSFADINKSSVDGYAAGVTLNLPVAPSIDVSVDLAHAWVEGNWDTNADALNVSGIYYLESGPGLKPFGGVSLGHTWATGDNSFTWGVKAGLEYQINSKISVTGTIAYDDDFESGDNGYFDGSVTGRYWFTRQLAGMVGVSWMEGGDFAYTAGVTYKF